MLQSVGDSVVVGVLALAKDNDEDVNARTLKRMLHVLDRFRLINSTMSVHLVTALLRVALDEGKSVIHYARDSGVSQSVMSRHLLDLGVEYRSGKSGLGMIEKRRSGHSLREYEVYLTMKGRKAIKEVADILVTGNIRL